ncbi:MAG: GreA/GreB family elongation factor [gamma proteobacterium symbiont of Lucinoma myriamae]|nr:GreA/GreB family elongation factor [gamma proteobacterium symbiont of Lucinoma myriamae]MCU7817652.1 GreA/GreB family elongation factor [gamma proteobacterium symbiont of Lucinoma myriamae]MCU7833563.1 GreA/GreB family elongation factor [gamma proteobacterium symbiont of Lucinoma myriamae]
MNKSLLLKHILAELEHVYHGAVDAAQRAYETATDDENEAENKYDTLGLEASYLAHGQSKRVAECEADVIVFKKLEPLKFLSDNPVAIGALVYIEDELGDEQVIFLSPVAGGLKIKFNNKEITLITQSSPIGKALFACFVDEEIEVAFSNDKKPDNKKLYQITAIY